MCNRRSQIVLRASGGFSESVLGGSGEISETLSGILWELQHILWVSEGFENKRLEIPVLTQLHILKSTSSKK